MKKSYYFTADALLALSFVILGIVIIYSLYMEETQGCFSTSISRDVLNVLSLIKVKDINNSLIQELIDNGTIKNENNSVLDQIAEFWALGKKELAKRVFENITFYLLKDVDYEFKINGEKISKNANKNYTYVFKSVRIISGITYNKTFSGYLARAIARKTIKNNTFILKGDIISSSVKYWFWNNGNKVKITYYFNIPYNSTVYDAKWFIETSWTDNRFKAYINDIPLDSLEYQGSHTYENLGSYIKEGENNATIVVRYGFSGPEAGEDGASHLIINYSTQSMFTLQDYSTYYFPKVMSNCSIRYKKPIFVLGELQSVYISLHTNSTKVYLYLIVDGNEYFLDSKSVSNYYVEWSNSEIKSLLSSHHLNYTNLSNKYVYFKFDFDSYSQSCLPSYTRVIFPDSKIIVKTNKEVKYGKIDITKPLSLKSYQDPLDDSFYRDITWNFTKYNNTEILNVDAQLAWLRYVSQDYTQKIYSNSDLLYSAPPQNLIPELARFGYTKEITTFNNGENTFRLLFTGGYGVNPFTSIVSYTVLIDNSVPYGEVFLTREEAVNDAIKRLNETLGDFVKVLEIDKQTIELSNVPSLWGPVNVELFIYKK